MSRIALRVYNNEINDLIDHRQIEEATAHCRFILKTHPKHVDTYRLLGKAYLEEQRYGDAADILQRVLSSIPEDFIAQVGMSIIREDEGNLDAAIYHMERAFETQPSNHAIQDEMRRLIAKREGMEPPRIRLTRGALARMYAHGHLYEQAIAELLAALSEDPQRFDLQVLLAKMYYQSDKKVDAAETCTKVIDKLPYCLDANRILTIILEESNRKDDAKPYRSRWEALDPYAAHLEDITKDVEHVPDQAVLLDRLEWEPEFEPQAKSDLPAWASSMGVSMGAQDQNGQNIPAWITGTSEGTGEEPAGLGDQEEETPDWMAATSEEPGLFADETTPGESSPQADWLAETGEEEEGFDIFSDQAEAETGKPAEEDDFFASLMGESAQEEEPDLFAAEPSESQPDWMKEFAAEPAAESPEEEDDWLAQFGTQQEEPAEEEIEEVGEELPDFLQDAGWEPSSGEAAEEPPDYLEEEEIIPEEETAIEAGDIPDWVKDLAPSEDRPASSQAGEVPVEVDQEWEQALVSEKPAEMPDWLSELDEIGAKEELETAPEEEKPAESPDWLSALDEEAEEEVEPAKPAGAVLESDEDDMAWLEGLAAKQGIPDEELVTSPEQRAKAEGHIPTGSLKEETTVSEEEERPADAFINTSTWLASLDAETTDAKPDAGDTADWLATLDQEPEEEEAAPKTAAIFEEEDELSMDWLDEISQEAAAEAAEGEEASAQAGDTEDWLASLGKEPESEEIPETPTVFEEEDELSTDWLTEISQEAASEAAAGEDQEEEFEDTGEWLASLGVTAEEAPEPEGASEAEDEFSMDWLNEISQEAAAEAAEGEAAPPQADDNEDWLASLDQEPEETAAAKSTSAFSEEEDELSTDWLDEISQEAAAEAAEGEAVAPQADETADWLASLGTETEEEVKPTPAFEEEEEEFSTDWLDEISQEAAAEAAETPARAEEAEFEDTGAWLASLGVETKAEPEPEAALEEDELSMDWLDEISQEAAAEAAEGEPVADLSAPETPLFETETEPEPQQEPPFELEEETLPGWLAEEEPAVETEVHPTQAEEWLPEPAKSTTLPAAEPEQPAAAVKPAPDSPEAILDSGRQALKAGDLEIAVKSLTKLVKRGKMVEQIIHETREALRRHPVDVGLWQLLGDALMRTDNLQDALDAYSKAEDLLR